MISKDQLVRLLHVLAETTDIPPRELAAAALEYANSVFGRGVGAGEKPAGGDDRPNREGLVPAAPTQLYTGPVRLCLDFGTAMSKAFAWDKDEDTPIPLKIGAAAGEPSSPYALNSAIFVTRDGLVLFGQSALQRASDVSDPENHQAMQSIKDFLTVGSVTSDLQDPVPTVCNPGAHPITRKMVIALYLAYLTDSALLALRDDLGEEHRDVPRSYTKPVFEPEFDEWATGILTECATVGQGLADRFSGRWAQGIPITEVVEAMPQAPGADNSLVIEHGVLPEPVACFAGRIRNFVPDHAQRSLMMVVDVGAGTTDFAMFARVQAEGETGLRPIPKSVGTIRVAGDAVDNALMDYLLDQAGVASHHTRYGAITGRTEARDSLDKGRIVYPRVGH